MYLGPWVREYAEPCRAGNRAWLERHTTASGLIAVTGAPTIGVRMRSEYGRSFHARPLARQSTSAHTRTTSGGGHACSSRVCCAQIACVLACSVAVERERRKDTLESFASYWRKVETGVGMLPHAYRELPPASRREVRNKVQAELAKYVSAGRLVPRLEMLIGAGRA